MAKTATMTATDAAKVLAEQSAREARERQALESIANEKALAREAEEKEKLQTNVKIHEQKYAAVLDAREAFTSAMKTADVFIDPQVSFGFDRMVRDARLGLDRAQERAGLKEPEARAAFQFAGKTYYAGQPVT